MAKKTLLEIVQIVLSDMSSDDVSSIDDSVEAQQVANIVIGCYDEMMANRNWPHTKKLMPLQASASLSKPCFFKIPEEVKELKQIEYYVGTAGFI
jgi:hypothetical protein